MSDETCIHCGGRGPHYDVTDCLVSYKLRLAQAKRVIAVADRLRAADAEGRWLHDWYAYDAERAKLGAAK